MTTNRNFFGFEPEKDTKKDTKITRVPIETTQSTEILASAEYKVACLFSGCEWETDDPLLTFRRIMQSMQVKNVDVNKLLKGLDWDKVSVIVATYPNLTLSHYSASAKLDNDPNWGVLKSLASITGSRYIYFENKLPCCPDESVRESFDTIIKTSQDVLIRQYRARKDNYPPGYMKSLMSQVDKYFIKEATYGGYEEIFDMLGIGGILESDDWKKLFTYTMDPPSGKIFDSRPMSYLPEWVEGNLGNVHSAVGSLTELFDSPLIVFGGKEVSKFKVGVPEHEGTKYPENFIVVNDKDVADIVHPSIASLDPGFSWTDYEHKMKSFAKGEFISPDERLKEIEVYKQVLLEESVKRGIQVITGDTEGTPYKEVIQVFHQEPSNKRKILSNTEVFHLASLTEAVAARGVDSRLMILTIDPSRNLVLIGNYMLLMSARREWFEETDHGWVMKGGGFRWALFPTGILSDLAPYWGMHRAISFVGSIHNRVHPLPKQKLIDLFFASLSRSPTGQSEQDYINALSYLVYFSGYEVDLAYGCHPLGAKAYKNASQANKKEEVQFFNFGPKKTSREDFSKISEIGGKLEKDEKVSQKVPSLGETFEKELQVEKHEMSSDESEGYDPESMLDEYNESVNPFDKGDET